MKHDWCKFYSPGMDQEIDLSNKKNIASVLDAACERFGDNIALTCEGADLSYRDLERLSAQFASYLQHEVGLKKGDRLAIMVPNLMQFPIAFYAAQKIGVICVNTNPRYVPREMKYQFKDSGATAIVIIDLFLNNLEEIIKDTNIKTVISTSYWDYLPAWKAPIVKIGMKLKKMIPSHNLKTICFKEAVAKGAAKPVSPVEIGHQDIAVLQYTGGTTGVSKGAVLTNSNILANMLQIQNIAKVQVKEGHECVLTALPLYHIFALTVNFLSFLAMGQRMILVPLPIPLSNVVKAFKKYPITVMTGINTLFNGLNNNSDFKANPPRSLRIALAGGMALQEAVNKQWQQLTGMPIIEGFGLTESSPVTHVNPLDGHMRIGSIGIPVASTDAKCVGPDGKEVPNGQPGELIIKGPQVMKEYWNQPEDTAKTIKNGWLWTGDIAIRDEDGFFKIVDRKKDMILVSGFNVFPNEVEGVLMLHAKVLEAAVIGIPDKTSGEAVKALVVPKDKSLTVDEIKQHCHDQLTGYKRPRHIEFRESLPKSNVGKILRRELRDEELARKQK